MATVTTEDTDIDAVLRLADNAMYDAKRRKKSGLGLEHRAAEAAGIAVDAFVVEGPTN